ncbi:MAG TPA: biotin/lipoyl-containing protein [Candidatus Acidoferrales bacterium]|nr:biotin/lipoyl-containing protein [Candidatus Acidoferrales bacterium]
MKLDIEIGGAGGRQIELTRDGSRVKATIDGRKVEADAVVVGKGVYSVLAGGRSFEVRIEEHGASVIAVCGGGEFHASIRDPRKFRRGSGAHSAEGRLEVTARMPGKVVRILVHEGETVIAGQGLLVVEAMKMQNEIRSPKAGTVEKVIVSEGQPVNAGDSLAIVA